MLEFRLSKAPATLENFNSRTEKSGPDKIPAADLKVSCPQPADTLQFFSPTLKSMLFDEKAPKDLAEGMPLRDPHMVYPLARDEEMTGATVEIDYGVGEPMVFQDCKVNSFRLTPWAGGTVIIGFRVQCRPDEKQAGRLFMLQELAITVTVTPPELQKALQEAA
jgi:hypothetical protein